MWELALKILWECLSVAWCCVNTEKFVYGLLRIWIHKVMLTLFDHDWLKWHPVMVQESLTLPRMSYGQFLCSPQLIWCNSLGHEASSPALLTCSHRCLPGTLWCAGPRQDPRSQTARTPFQRRPSSRYGSSGACHPLWMVRFWSVVYITFMISSF